MGRNPYADFRQITILLAAFVTAAIAAPLIFAKLVPDNHVLPFAVPGRYTIDFEAAGGHLIYQEFDEVGPAIVKERDENAFADLKIDLYKIGQKTRPLLISKVPPDTRYRAGTRRGYSRYEFHVEETGAYELNVSYPSGSGRDLILSIGRKSLSNKIARISIVLLIVVVNAFLLVSTAVLVFGWLKKR